MTKTVVLDTNFLLIPGRKHRDVIGELQKEGFEVITLTVVVQELEAMALKASNTASAARIALSLIKRKGLKVARSSAGYADEAILVYSKAHICSASTQDLALRRKLRSAVDPIVTYNRS